MPTKNSNIPQSSAPNSTSGWATTTNKESNVGKKYGTYTTESERKAASSNDWLTAKDKKAEEARLASKKSPSSPVKKQESPPIKKSPSPAASGSAAPSVAAPVTGSATRPDGLQGIVGDVKKPNFSETTVSNIGNIVKPPSLPGIAAVAGAFGGLAAIGGATGLQAIATGLVVGAGVAGIVGTIQNAASLAQGGAQGLLQQGKEMATSAIKTGASEITKLPAATQPATSTSNAPTSKNAATMGGTTSGNGGSKPTASTPSKTTAKTTGKSTSPVANTATNATSSGWVTTKTTESNVGKKYGTYTTESERKAAASNDWLQPKSTTRKG